MAPSRFLLDFASKEWQASNGGKGKRGSPSGKGVKVGDGNLQKRNSCGSKLSSSTGGDASVEQSGEVDGPVLPISLIDTLDPEERALIVGGKVEAYWSDLTIRLKSALRSEAQAREALQDALDEVDVLQDEADSARKETKRVTKEKRELEKEIQLLRKELSKAGVTPHKVGIGADPWTDMDKHWAREAVETTGDLARAKKLQENVRQSPEKEMKSISRSIEALERILPAISSCLLTWSNPDSPRKRQGNERQASRRRAEQVERGGTSEISRAHSTDGQSTLQESTVGRPGSDWQTQPWSPLPFQAASAHISIAAATSILASPSAMVSMTPSKNEESRIVHLVSGMYEGRTASSNRSYNTPISKHTHHARELEGVDVDSVLPPEGSKFFAPSDGVRLKTPRQLPFEVLGPAHQHDVSRRLSLQKNSEQIFPLSSAQVASPPKSMQTGRTTFGLSMSAMNIAFENDRVQHQVGVEQAIESNADGLVGQAGSPRIMGPAGSPRMMGPAGSPRMMGQAGSPNKYTAHGRVEEGSMASPRGSHRLPAPPHYEHGGRHQRDMSPGDKGSPQSRMSPVQKVTAALVSAVRIQSPQSPHGASPGPYAPQQHSPGPYIPHQNSPGLTASRQHSPGPFISHQNVNGASPRPNQVPGMPKGVRTSPMPVVFASSPPPGMPIVLSAADAMRQAANISADSVALC